MKIRNLKLAHKTVLAPLANFSDHAFRIICRRFQAALVFTEKFNVNALVNNFKAYEDALQVYEEEHPISIQLIGNAPQIFSKAMDLLSSYDYDAFDLNLGWPAPEAIRSETGGALLQRPEKIKPLIRAMVNATNKPVSAKIRIGFDASSINAVEVAQLIEGEGADFLTVHGRTVKAFYSGEVNFEVIRTVKEHLNIPVIGNGDIIGGLWGEQMFKKTNCDLIMIGREAMKNPRIFLEINAFLEGKPLPALQDEEHIELIQQYDTIAKMTRSILSRDCPFFKKAKETKN